MQKSSCVVIVSAFVLGACGGGADAPGAVAAAPAAAEPAPVPGEPAPVAGEQAPVASEPAPVPAVPVPAPGEPEPEFVPSPMEPPEEAPAQEGEEAAPAAQPAGTPGGDDFAISGYVPAGQDTADVAATAATATDGGGWQGMAHALGAARTLYVSPKGDDANPGTAARPFRSLARAARAVQPGTTVLVAPGQYSGGVRTLVSGSARQRIAFISTRKWGALITPARQSPNKTGWDNRGSHVDIVGFDVDGSAHQGGVRWTHGIYSAGSYDAIRNNRVRNIARAITCKGAGGAGIGVDSFYGGVHADVTSNLVHDIGPSGCRFVQGIYVSTSARVKNNVVYRVAEGGIHLWHDANNVIITNNTVTGSNTGIIVGGGNFYRGKGSNDHTAVYSNLVYDNKMGISEQGATGKNNTYRNNLVFQNTTYNWRLKNGLVHSGTVSAAPLFRTPARSAQPDLRPAPGSPVIGKGTALHADSTDFDGRPRNARAGYDIGAYQH